MTRTFLLMCAAIALATSAFADSVIVDKTPDVGPYWNPLGGHGTYVYANSFLAPSSVSANILGIYLTRMNGSAGTPIRFELWADNGNTPEGGAVLGVTGYHQYPSTTLTLQTAQMSAPVSLVAGTRYWVIGSAVGQTWQGNYQVGAHTQGADGGTFRYSNDPNGVGFTTEGSTPEMAIYVASSAASVPEPSPLTALVLPLAAGLLLRKRN
ncbi:MAG: hypothetical protein JST65_21840 [Acidobacteria bacterium]|nr:hypothetical protein [Acidobacteriota bacterium]